MKLARCKECYGKKVIIGPDWTDKHGIKHKGQRMSCPHCNGGGYFLVK